MLMLLTNHDEYTHRAFICAHTKGRLDVIASALTLLWFSCKVMICNETLLGFVCSTNRHCRRRKRHKRKMSRCRHCQFCPFCRTYSLFGLTRMQRNAMQCTHNTHHFRVRWMSLIKFSLWHFELCYRHFSVCGRRAYGVRPKSDNYPTAHAKHSQRGSIHLHCKDITLARQMPKRSLSGWKQCGMGWIRMEMSPTKGAFVPSFRQRSQTMRFHLQTCDHPHPWRH